MANINRNDDELYYVAPTEALAPRRAPIREIGIIHWLRENLFKSVTDTIITIITFTLIMLFLQSFLSWALFEAQWEIVFLNLRVLGVGNQFPASEVWRVEVAAFILVFLSLVSVAVWGRVTRSFVVVAALLLLLMFVIPTITMPVPEPTIHTYLATGYEPRQVAFTAETGQEITFRIDPLTAPEDYTVESLSGYIENDNQGISTSFDAYNERATGITFQGEDPSGYDLQVAVQVVDARGDLVFQSDFTDGTDITQSFTWEVPADGWYIYTAVYNEEAANSEGAAWLEVDNVEIFRSTNPAAEARAAEYGPEPAFTCENCGVPANRTDMRFQGSRSLAQFFSLQLAPYLLELRPFFFTALIVGAVGYLLGIIGKRVNFANDNYLIGYERTLGMIGGTFFVLYIAIQVLLLIYPESALSTIRLITVTALVVTGLLYALIQFAKDDPRSLNRALGLMWLLSIPVVLTLLGGLATPVETGDPALPAIPSSDYGGLLLTLLLSFIAIALSFPIGIVMALGRQSKLPVVSLLCTLYIELFRGVPLITLLFMGRLILPFFGFGLAGVDLLVRIIVVMTLFTSAYMAEVVRGGLQIIPKGQYEASYALGLNSFWTTVLVVLPQALRAVIPAIMGQAVSLFKDTSLVYIVGLFEILGSMNQILGDSQTGYTLFPREGYLYIGVVYFVISYLMADVSRRLERTGAGAIRRETL
ncbi:MAG: hypothetical protein OHK0046_51080 [Anaerolineae bacterium]